MFYSNFFNTICYFNIMFLIIITAAVLFTGVTFTNIFRHGDAESGESEVSALGESNTN